MGILGNFYLWFFRRKLLSPKRGKRISNFGSIVYPNSTMTADQLRELLERRDSPTSGTKRELVTRLREAIASPAEAAELEIEFEVASNLLRNLPPNEFELQFGGIFVEFEQIIFISRGHFVENDSDKK